MANGCGLDGVVETRPASEFGSDDEAAEFWNPAAADKVLKGSTVKDEWILIDEAILVVEVDKGCTLADVAVVVGMVKN